MFSLPELGYSYDALEPYIDAKTMEIHYNKHHGGYVSGLNTVLENYKELSDKKVEDLLIALDTLPEATRTGVRNLGGGHYNHSFFWKLMNKNGSHSPSGSLQNKITGTFNNFEEFQLTFEKAGLARFGSGWVWLVVDKSKKLKVYSTPNQDSPISEGLTPVLGLDVWEHAYYLKYQQKRQEYIRAWWNVVDWSKVEELYSKL